MKVFISHSSKDHDFVLLLAERLKKDGIDVWVDEWELKAGDSILERINEGLENSSFLTIVFSEHSTHSDWVLRELNSTLMRQLTQKDVKILPILLEVKSKELPPLLSDIYAVKFSRDSLNETEYRKLVMPIKEKSKSEALKNHQDRFFENTEHVDLILSKQQPTRAEINFILKLIQDAPYQNYFFERLSSLFWFDILKAEGYFKPSEDTKPQENLEEGFYSIPLWNVLAYLERVSVQVNLRGNERYIDELLHIIKEVTDYHIKNNRVLDNHRTWWHFTKILLNIPTTKIPLEVIELAGEWLDSKFDTDPYGADIVMKLLPRFLSSDDPKDHEKAEEIVEIVTRIKWIKIPKERAKILGESEEAKTVVNSYWLLKSFSEISPKVGERCSDEIIYTVADRLKMIFSRKRNKTWGEAEFDNTKYRIDIRLFEDNECTVSIGLIKEKELAETEETRLLSEGPLAINELEFSIRDCVSNADFNQGLRGNLIAQHRFSKAGSEFLNSISRLYESLFYDYSYIWYPSIYDKPEVGEGEPNRVLVTILKDILLSKSKSNIIQTTPILDKFLSEEYRYPVFKRIVLFIAGNCWQDYKNFLIKMIKTRDAVELFTDPNYQPELYELLRRNHNRIGKREKELIMAIIQNGPKIKVTEKKDEKYVAYWKQKWCLPLKSDPEFRALYEEQRRIVDIPETQIEYKSVTQTRWGPGPSPISKEGVLGLSNEDLAQRLRQFKTADSWKGPTIGGLAEVLKEAAKENPNKFADNLKPFKNTGFIYVYEILSGIKEGWKQKISIEWDKIFEFIRLYIDRDEFWDDRFVVEEGEWLGGADHFWVVGIVAEIIEEGTRDDSWAFPEEHFEEAKDILFLTLDHLKVEEEEDIRDFVTHALNSPHGKTLTAYILLALRIARVNTKKGLRKKTKWDAQVRAKYDEILTKKVIEGFTLLGRYLPNFCYLDTEWAEDKIQNLTKQKGSRCWEAFMNGYLSIGRVYDDLYRLMKGHYYHGIHYDFRQAKDREYLVQHISFEFLRGNENIEDRDSLFSIVLESWNPQCIREVISTFWMQRDYLKKDSPENMKIKARIISFWRWVYENKYKGKREGDLLDADRQILSQLAELTTFLERIDSESFEWISVSAPYADEVHNSSFFIEYLNEFEDEESIVYVGHIFLRMLERFTPDYKKENILSIIEKLFQRDQTEAAERICNIYGERRHDFVKKAYHKFRKR